MVEHENEDHLNKLYKLLKNMEAPLARLVKMFKNNVEKIGKTLIKEAKTPMDFVNIVCKHYDDYRKGFSLESPFFLILFITRKSVFF